MDWTGKKIRLPYFNAVAEIGDGSGRLVENMPYKKAPGVLETTTPTT
jgi:hypothetical protein